MWTFDRFTRRRGLADRFAGTVTFRHIRREHNSRADALCNEALDGARLAAPNEPTKSLAPAKPATLNEEAVRCLREAILAWAGEADGPTPEELWKQLRQLIEQHGAKLPS